MGKRALLIMGGFKSHISPYFMRLCKAAGIEILLTRPASPPSLAVILWNGPTGGERLR